MYALSKLNKQNEQTWVNLQKRLNEVQFQYRSLFTTAEVHNFVKNKSLAVGSCEGYFIPSLLTTTAYVLAANQATVQTLTHSQPLNIFTIFVGYPGTGKLFWFHLYWSNTLEALFFNRWCFNSLSFSKKNRSPIECRTIVYSEIFPTFLTLFLQENLPQSNTRLRIH